LLLERCFQKVKTWRAVATRYDKSPESFEAGLHLRGSIIWLKHLTNHMIRTPKSS
jgi:transposase